MTSRLNFHSSLTIIEYFFIAYLLPYSFFLHSVWSNYGGGHQNSTMVRVSVFICHEPLWRISPPPSPTTTTASYSWSDASTLGLGPLQVREVVGPTLHTLDNIFKFRLFSSHSYYWVFLFSFSLSYFKRAHSSLLDGVFMNVGISWRNHHCHLTHTFHLRNFISVPKLQFDGGCVDVL